MPIKLKNFAELTWNETLRYYATLLGSPFVILRAILSLPFVNRHGKTRLRYIHDTFLQSTFDRFTASQFQKFLGSDEGVYRAWAKGAKVEPVIETIPESGGKRIFWTAGRPQRSTKVIFYLHGGAFVMPVQNVLLLFYHYVQRTVSHHASNGENCTVAIVEYSFATQVSFPTQLREATTALQHILRSGVDPQQIIITGDSAGANLTYQLLQHILNPRLRAVPALEFSTQSKLESIPMLPFAGVFFMSPWFDLEGKRPSFSAKLNVRVDTVTPKFLHHCASITLGGLEPDDDEGRRWLLGELSTQGLDRIVKRVLVYGGGREMLIDSILEFSGRLESAFTEPGRYELLVGEIGVHDDVVSDFAIGQGPNKEAKRTAEWFCETFGYTA